MVILPRYSGERPADPHPRRRQNDGAGRPGAGGPHRQRSAGGAYRRAVLTRGGPYVAWLSGRPGTVDTALTSMPCPASMVSTSPDWPSNTSGPSVIVSVALPPVADFLTSTPGMVDSRRSTPARTLVLPSPADSASV